VFENIIIVGKGTTDNSSTIMPHPNG